MRTHLYIPAALAIAALAAGACKTDVIAPEPAALKTISVKAGTPDSKTVISTTGENTYKVSWKQGDQIQLFEWFNSELAQGDWSNSDIYYSDPLPADTDNASFDVGAFPKTAPDGDLFRYVGFHPGFVFNSAEWAEDHPTFMLIFQSMQCPEPDSFDPNSDVMVSEEVTSATQPEDLSLAFGRVGTIIRMTLKGLPAGASIINGFISTENVPLWGYIIYDPVLKTWQTLSEKGGGIKVIAKGKGDPGDENRHMSFYQSPGELVADASGNVDIWLRTLSGVEEGGFRVTVVLDGEKPVYYSKTVDLASKGKTLTLHDNALTAFSVTLVREPHVSCNQVDYTVGETTASLDLVFDLDGAAGTSFSYGAILVDNYDTDVTVDTADPSKVYAIDVDAQYKGCLSLEGLTPDKYYMIVPFVNIDGKYSYCDPLGFTTEAHFEYPVPELVDLGLPSGVKWASCDIGATTPLGEGYYFYYGETKPRKYFTSTNKYWMPVGEYSGYALKYSTCSRYGGTNDMVDLRTVLEPADDAATVNLGSGWRTPTYEDFEEMMTYCTWQQVFADGDTPAYYKWTSKVEGYTDKYIILPEFGYCKYYYGSRHYADHNFHMTASICPVDSRGGVMSGAFYYLDENSLRASAFNRDWAVPVRPVYGGSAPVRHWNARLNVPVTATSTTATISGTFYNEEKDGYTYTYYAALYYSTDDGNSNDQVKTFAGRNSGAVTFTGLTPGHRYAYQIYYEGKKPVPGSPTNSYVDSDGSEVLTFTTPE